MKITTERAQRLMKRCQIGVGGRNALNDAHDIMAECYGVIGALLAERDRLMLEFCQEDMDKSKIDAWADAQRAMQ